MTSATATFTELIFSGIMQIFDALIYTQASHKYEQYGRSTFMPE
jgi:hypothetical protein